MTLHQSTLGQRIAPYQDLVRVLLVVVAVIALMLVMTAVFGVHQAVPSYQIVPDPAAGLGLTF